jgi:hypothetical protein
MNLRRKGNNEEIYFSEGNYLRKSKKIEANGHKREER